MTLRHVGSVMRAWRAIWWILRRVSKRVRKVLGEVDRPCRACGSGCVVAFETRSRVRLLDRFRADPDRRVTRYDTCLDCRTTVRVSTVDPRRAGGDDTIGPGYVAL